MTANIREMKVNIRGTLRQVVSALEKRKKCYALTERDKMAVGMYQQSLLELSENLQKLADDPASLDEFLVFYTLKKED